MTQQTSALIYLLSSATNLKDANRDYFDVVAFTHLDDDHICGSSKFFYLEHAIHRDRLHCHRFRNGHVEHCRCRQWRSRSRQYESWNASRRGIKMIGSGCSSDYRNSGRSRPRSAPVHQGRRPDSLPQRSEWMGRRFNSCVKWPQSDGTEMGQDKPSITAPLSSVLVCD